MGRDAVPVERGRDRHGAQDRDFPCRVRPLCRYRAGGVRPRNRAGLFPRSLGLAGNNNTAREPCWNKPGTWRLTCIRVAVRRKATPRVKCTSVTVGKNRSKREISTFAALLLNRLYIRPAGSERGAKGIGEQGRPGKKTRHVAVDRRTCCCVFSLSVSRGVVIARAWLRGNHAGTGTRTSASEQSVSLSPPAGRGVHGPEYVTLAFQFPSTIG